MPRTQWTGHDENQWRPVGASTPVLKPAFYNLSYGITWYLEEFTPKHDNIVRMGVANILYEAMQSFWAQRDEYTKLGFIHKCSYLLAGPPGTGKTIAAITACAEVISNGGVTLLLPPRFCEHPEIMVAALRGIREIHPEMPIAVIWEDIDKICAQDGNAMDRATMSDLLDGETQISNIVHIATTNYFDRIDKAFRNRPGRFSVLWVGPPNLETRLAYLKTIMPDGNPTLIEEVATKSEGLIIDHLKSMLVNVFIHKVPVNDVMKHLKEMNQKSDEAKAPELTFAGIFMPMMEKVMKSKGTA